MAIFLFDTCDGNVEVPPAALPPELEIAVARATSRQRPFLAHPAHLLPSESSLLSEECRRFVRFKLCMCNEALKMLCSDAAQSEFPLAVLESNRGARSRWLTPAGFGTER